MSACREWKDRLMDLALGGLRDADGSALKAHLAGCEACTAALAEMRGRAEEIGVAVSQLVRGAELRPGFAARVLAGIEARPLPLRRFSSRLVLPVAVLLTALVVVAVLRPSLDRWWPGFAAPTLQRATPLSTWRSPTDSLLRSSSGDLLRSAPRLGNFYFRLEPVRSLPGKGNGGNKNES